MHTAKCLFAECQNKGTRQNTYLPSARKKALGKDAFCRVPKNGTRQNTSLPSVRKKALGKDAFCRVPKNGTRQNTSLLSAEKNTRQSHLCRVFFLPSVFYLALGKDRLCRVSNKIHSAKCRFPVVCIQSSILLLWILVPLYININLSCISSWRVQCQVANWHLIEPNGLKLHLIKRPFGPVKHSPFGTSMITH